MQACAPDIGAFAVALQDNRALPAGIVGPDGLPDHKRFAIYRNNVAVGLIGALRDSFPVLAALVGDECFDGLARGFIAQHLPRSPVLFTYGAGFDAFLAQSPGLEDFPVLPALARLERARIDAYHAADARTLSLSALADIPPEGLDALCLAPLPSLVLLSDTNPFVSVWRAHQNDTAPDLSRIAHSAEFCAVYRDALDEVVVLPLEASTFVLAANLAEGAPLAEAAALMAEGHPDADPGAALVALVGAGLFSACHFTRKDQE